MERIDKLISEFFEQKKQELQRLCRDAWCSDRLEDVIAYREAIEGIDEILARYGNSKGNENENRKNSNSAGRET